MHLYKVRERSLLGNEGNVAMQGPKKATIDSSMVLKRKQVGEKLLAHTLDRHHLKRGG